MSDTNYIKIKLDTPFKIQHNIFIDLIENKSLLRIKEFDSNELDNFGSYSKPCEHMKHEVRKPTQEEINNYEYDEDEEVESLELVYPGLFKSSNGFNNFLCPICRSEYIREFDIVPETITKQEFLSLPDPISKASYGQLDYTCVDYYDDCPDDPYICCKEIESNDEYKIFMHQFEGENDFVEIRHKPNIRIDEIFYYDDFVVLKTIPSEEELNKKHFYEKMGFLRNKLNDNSDLFLLDENNRFVYVDFIDNTISIFSNTSIGRNRNTIMDVSFNVIDMVLYKICFKTIDGSDIKCKLVDISTCDSPFIVIK